MHNASVLSFQKCLPKLCSSSPLLLNSCVEPCQRGMLRSLPSHRCQAAEYGAILLIYVLESHTNRWSFLLILKRPPLLAMMAVVIHVSTNCRNKAL